MSGKKNLEILLFIATFCILTYYPCRSVSLGNSESDFKASKFQESSAAKWIRLDPQEDGLLPDNKVKTVEKLHKRKWPGLINTKPDLTSLEQEAILRQLQENGINPKSLTWTAGNVSLNQKSPTYKSAKGYQSDHAGFLPVQGKILGVSPDTTHLSEWLRMRPLVHCDQNVMTFTASGGGFTNLLVGRDGDTPISLFDLPPVCGYVVKTQWGDLEMSVPYDACYIMEEDGNIVLPVEWWGSPLKLSCPMWKPTPAPAVYCSPYGMLVVVAGQEDDLPTLGFKVNGRWGPLVAAECAILLSSQPKKFLFFIPTTAACIIDELGVHLWLLMDEMEYILSCPEYPPLPPPFPSEPQFPFFPDPVSPAPPSTPPPPTSPYLDPIYQHPDFPQVYPPAPQPPKRPTPTADAPPGFQPQHHVHSLLPYFEGGYIKPYTPHPPPVKTPAPLAPNLNMGHYFAFPQNFPFPQDLQHFYNSYASYLYSKYPTKPTVNPSPPQLPNFPHLHLSAHHFQIPYHLSLQMTTPATPQTVPPIPPRLPLPSVHFPFASQTDSFYNPFHFNHQTSVNVVSPSSSVKFSFPPVVPELHKHCFPYGDKFCPYYPSPYYPYYHPPHSPMYPPRQPPTSGPHPPFLPPSHTIQHYCLGDRMFVLLPFAHPDSIQVKDQTHMWIFLSNVPAFCWYKLHWSDGAGLILHTPLPGCHTQNKFDASTSLSLRYWDISLAHFRTVDVHCPQQPATPPPLIPPSTAPPFTFEPPKESCSVHHMIIEFPPVYISEICVIDLHGNRIKLQDVSKDCGYSVSMGKDGKLRLSIPLHLHCPMILQASTDFDTGLSKHYLPKGLVYTITVSYTTFLGTKEAQFSCPGDVVPIIPQECKLPSDKRLPCGPAPVFQSQCISMGCCFSSHPRACYYPMDECTADRHFVFSVPASLMEPPLSLPFLVAGGNSSCGPQQLTSDSALFKIPMDDCGARRMQVGKTLIYMLEVNNIINSVSLNYGTITRDSPIRLLVECRFLPGSALTVSYMVKTPTFGPAIQTQGAFGVQLRIAKDSQYKMYYPQHHQPLQVLLDKPLYLEVRMLNSPDPSLVLLVHYCVAYPRSGKDVWVLLYNGCPNPLDPHPNQVVVSNPEVPIPAQTRRFTISTFQFLPNGKFMDSQEEIYIMCGTELCSTQDGPCVEGCFAQ